MSANNYQEYKDFGNERFKLKDYEGAKEYYSKAIEANNNEPVAYSNMAACNINLKQYYYVVEDCNRAIELDPSMSKAHYRRAIALRHLSRLNLALEDFKKTLQLDPGNKVVKEEINKLEDLLEKNTRLDIECYDKPEKFRSTRPMQHFPLNNQYSGSKQYIL